MPTAPAVYADLAERSWAWVLTQVRSGEQGLWLPEQPGQTEPGDYPYGMHSGIGGLAHVLSEIRLARPLTDAEHALAAGIVDTLVRRIPEETEYDYFDGLVSTIGILTALGAPGADLAVARLLDLATPDGWQPSFLGRRPPWPRVAATTPPWARQRSCSAPSGRCGTTYRAPPTWPPMRPTS